VAGDVVTQADAILELPLFEFDTRDEACTATADALAVIAQTALDNGRRARIALSGGSSPAPAYRAFAQKDLDWSRVDIALVDDRWVDLTSPGSNEAMIRAAFEPASGVTIHTMYTGHATPFEGAQSLDPIYASLRPFDVMIMGMGPDAHTASWFSESPQLQACLDPASTHSVLGVDASTAPVAQPYLFRMTMTLPVVAEADQLVLLLFGADKKQILSAAIGTPQTQTPIQALVEACGERLVVFWAN
jgi:6-phosphogluconolactonase